MLSRKSERKPLSFSTTMRNPNRILSFLSCLLPYENQVLTHEVIMEVMHSAIRKKLYTPVIVKRIPELLCIYNDEEKEYTEKQIDYIIKMSPQNHKEAGFDFGWDSRFDTIFKLPMEFGFVKYAMGDKIKISTAGHMLIDAFKEEDINEEKIQAVFLNSMMKYQSNNPYRKNANSNVPLVLLLRVLKMLKDDKEENGTGVFRQELSLFICWPNNDAKALYTKIKQIRKELGYSYSDEYVYEICLGLLGASDNQRKRFKMSQICGEAVDEYIRKMRTTGIISLRGNGRFVDFNALKMDVIDYILNNYSDCKEFKSKNEYFEYIGQIDTTIISIKSAIPIDLARIKKNALKKYAEEYSKEDVYSELHKVCKKIASTDYLLKLLPGPVRLEFLTSIAMIQNFAGIDVTPNYTVDDEGLPTSTASGGKADIVCSYEEYQSLIEVSLMCGRQEQVNNEIVPIRRHLLKEKEYRTNTFSVFVAPTIHEDTRQMAEWYKYKEDLDIVTYDIEEFVDAIKNEKSIVEIVNRRTYE